MTIYISPFWAGVILGAVGTFLTILILGSISKKKENKNG